jgi:hypothetical protein
LQVSNRLRHPFSAESVYGPKQDAVKFPFGRILEQRSKLFPLVGALPAALMFNILARNHMASMAAPRPQFSQLVFWVLHFVVL